MTNVFQCSSSREFLSECLQAKQKKNKRYSLRKFAYDLQFSPSTLCEVMKGKKNLSESSTLRVINRLNLKGKEAEYLDQLSSYERCRNPELRLLLQDQIGHYRRKRPVYDLATDYFRILSDWHHSAIIAACEMTEKMNLQKISKVLNLPSHDVSLAVDRLIRLGLLSQKPNGELVAIDKDIQVTTKAPNLALQKFTNQMLQKASESQTQQTNEERVFGTETFAFDEKDLPKIRELTEEYFENVLKIVKKGKNKKTVYSVGVQAFRLSRKE